MRSGTRFGTSTLLTIGLSAMALVAATGCGGGEKSTPLPPASFTIGGTVAGLTGTGLVLQDDGGNNVTVSANATSFSFDTPVGSHAPYSVTVLAQPAGESCTVNNGSGMASANVTNVSVACIQLYAIGGTISGLTESGLVLEDNGGNSLAVNAGASSFAFPAPVVAGSTYAITVLTQPLGENCAVTGGSGTATGNVTSASVACTQQYAVGGTISGLAQMGLVLQNNGGNNLIVNANAASFAFTAPVASGTPYSVTVFAQPAGENCAVANGSATAIANITNVNIVCTGDWIWVGGSSSVGLNSGQPGVYGALGTPDPANLPGAREESAIWKDASGVIWLFGGNGQDSLGTIGDLNDLWKFDPRLGASGEWTWIGGSPTEASPETSYDTHGQPGVYGTLGVPLSSNSPGGREQSVNWIDAAGHLWLFGGIGVDAAGNYGVLNDLWEFDPKQGASGEWTWMGGSSTVPPVIESPQGVAGTYGTLGTPSPTNIPGARYGASAWTDAQGNFWLYSGNGYDANGTNGYLNDLWKYTPGTNLTPGSWTWMGGSATVPPNHYLPGAQTVLPGVYGTLGTAASTNIPGGRSAAVAWTDASGNFWLFGGTGGDSTATIGFLNDLWKFDPTLGDTGEWTWMGGSSTIPGANLGQPGVYGIVKTASSTSTPGGRYSPASWIDASGNFWICGGQGYDWTGKVGYLDDLWKYTPGAAGNIGQWTWMGGSNAVPSISALGTEYGPSGVYGTQGVPAAANIPGGRYGAAAWVDASGNVWLFGGQGDDASGALGYLDDLWKYQP
ncbi:N-acetylneuraminic acid mutarotase [Silvibacterium bohemicum]|uniref:N-acetylneuraminic acid mutarotase n=1 Tax=Silvibacterium bohemicum TaxID=1577686 RepID=A0A841JQV1_9BACT|nr:hypothetical protein [Silvibacterium bohemicum]MBB6143530.1 N-acetylneuraminic acid mutarotase [Silvibacterium bohemicum]